MWNTERSPEGRAERTLQSGIGWLIYYLRWTTAAIAQRLSTQPLSVQRGFNLVWLTGGSLHLCHHHRYHHCFLVFISREILEWLKPPQRKTEAGGDNQSNSQSGSNKTKRMTQMSTGEEFPSGTWRVKRTGRETEWRESSRKKKKVFHFFFFHHCIFFFPTCWIMNHFSGF